MASRSCHSASYGIAVAASEQLLLSYCDCCCCCCCCCCGGCCWAVGGIGGSGMAGLRRADGLRNVSRWWRITKRGPAGMRASAKALSFHNMMVLSVNSAFFKLSWYFGYPSVLSMYFPRSYSVSVLSGLKFCPICDCNQICKRICTTWSICNVGAGQSEG